MKELSRFTCEEAFRRLDDYLDRELSAHLEICAGCAREFGFEESVLRGVRTRLRQIDLPADLQSRVLRALEGDVV